MGSLFHKQFFRLVPRNSYAHSDYIDSGPREKSYDLGQLVLIHLSCVCDAGGAKIVSDICRKVRFGGISALGGCRCKMLMEEEDTGKILKGGLYV
jgi:hypothetical protein